MFINFPKYNLSFVLVPKNGTQSIRTLVLKEHDEYTKYDDIWTSKVNKYMSTKPLKNIIVITRNPYDRAVSCYLSKIIYNLKLPYFKKMVNQLNSIDDERISFEKYVNYLITCRKGSVDIHLRPQKLIIHKINNQNIHYCDIKSPKLNKLLKQFGVKHEIPLVSHKFADDKLIINNAIQTDDVTDKTYSYYKKLIEDDNLPEYKCFYNEDLKEIIYKYFSDDFECFGYNKEY
jgi:hypothetical protein